MCGICGNQPVAPLAVDLLKRMEYHGYDSTGIALMNDGTLVIKKEAGKIDDFASRYHLASLAGNTAVGHVRWEQ